MSHIVGHLINPEDLLIDNMLSVSEDPCWDLILKIGLVRFVRILEDSIKQYLQTDYGKLILQFEHFGRDKSGCNYKEEWYKIVSLECAEPRGTFYALYQPK